MSLLVGATALVLGLTLFFGPQDSGDPQTPAIKSSAQTTKALVGSATFNNGEMQLELTSAGAATIMLQTDTVPADAYPYLHLELIDPSKELTAAIFWTSGDVQHWLTLDAGAQKSLWIATAELGNWTGQISSLGMFLTGKPGETVRIRDFSIYPPSPRYQLASLYSDLTAFVPWNRAAMNTYTGVTSTSSFYPVALAVPLLALSLLAYGLLLLAFRKRVRFQWTVVALLFLACWVTLDLAWQTRLFKQVAETHRIFAGKSTAEKRAVGPDATLVNFVSKVEPLLTADDSRIFVASSDQYSGMRVAYYLYPRNVFWSLHLQELPAENFFRKGDYIALVKPTEFLFNEHLSALVAPRRARLSAQLLYTGPAGSLLRLN